MPEQEQERGKLRMKYEPTVLVDFDQMYAQQTRLSHEVRGGYNNDRHVPLRNQGKFGSARGPA